MFSLKILRSISLSVFCIFISFYASAQQSFTSTCIDAVLDNATISYSIGQLFYHNDIISDVSIKEGVQQPIFSVVTDIRTPASNMQIEVSPNPVEHSLLLQIENELIINASFYKLYNANGELLIHQKIIDEKTSINMNQFASSLYLLKIFDDKSLIKEIKILKK